MKLKKYTMEQLNKVKVVLNENEAKFLKGGYTVLQNGLVHVSYDELLIIYGNPFAVPSHILEDLGIDVNTAGISEIHEAMQSVGYFDLTVEELGVFGELWGLSNSSESGSESSSSSSESGGDEGGEQGQQQISLIDFVVPIANSIANEYQIVTTSLKYYSFVSLLYYALRNCNLSNANDLTFTTEYMNGYIKVKFYNEDAYLTFADLYL